MHDRKAAKRGYAPTPGCGGVEVASKLVTAVERLVGKVARDFGELGRALEKMRDKKLHAALGYVSFEARPGAVCAPPKRLPAENAS